MRTFTLKQEMDQQMQQQMQQLNETTVYNTTI